MGTTKTVETKTYIRPEKKDEEDGSMNAPKGFYANEGHTGYDPNDRRDMNAIDNSLKSTPEIIRETEEKANSRIRTPQGREIEKENFSFKSLAPEVFEKMETDENERALKAEKRAKGRQTGMLISDALKSLIDVVGEVKGAHNTARKPEDYSAVYSQLDKLDADHARALQTINGNKLRAAIQAEQGDGKDKDRELREAEIKRKQAQGDEVLDWRKEKTKQDQALKADQLKLKGEGDKAKIDADKEKAKGANAARIKVAQIAAQNKKVGSGSGEGTRKKYRYSTSDADRSNPNYKDIGADEEGTIEVSAEHVARYKDMYIDKYNKLVAERDRLMESGGDFMPLSKKIAAMENSDAYKAAFDASNGGVLTDSQASSLMKEQFSNESYLHMRNKEYTEAPKEEKPITYQGQEVLNRLLTNPDIMKVQQQPKTAPKTEVKTGTQPVQQHAKPTTQVTPTAQPQNAQPKQEIKYKTPGLNAKPGTPEHTKAVSKVATGDYRGLSEPERQDKVLYRVSNRVKKYHSEYGKDNKSPMAQNHKEKMSLEIYNELDDYWKHTPGAMNQLEQIAKKKSTKGHNITVSDVIMEIAEGVANGTKNINDIL